MNKLIQSKADWFHKLNKTARPGNIVFTGSTFMHNFPISELEHNFQMAERVYNRAIEGLRIADFHQVLDLCVFELAPSKLFISIGEEDAADGNLSLTEFTTCYIQTIREIQQKLPACKIHILGLMPTVREYRKINSALRADTSKLNCEFLDFGSVLLDSGNTIKEEYSKDKKTFQPGAYVAILRDLKMFFRNRMMGFGEVWNMVENWGY
jgi:hypothetical protein